MLYIYYLIYSYNIPMKHYCYLHLSAKKPKAQVQCQGHTVSKWQEKNSNLGQPDSKDCSEPWLYTPPTYKAIECFDYHLKRTWQIGEPLLSTSFLTQGSNSAPSSAFQARDLGWFQDCSIPPCPQVTQLKRHEIPQLLLPSFPPTELKLWSQS